jgi:hypothetical protein
MRKPNRPALLGLLLLTLSGPALADCTEPDPGLELSAADIGRLQGLLGSRKSGLRAAVRGELANERDIVAALYAETPGPVATENLSGSYQCRTIKMGGLLPLIVYDWFRCSIEADADNYTLTKLTGSQNFTGTLFPQADGSLLYRGAGNYGDEAPRTYGEDPERNQVGCFWSVGQEERHFILELPAPPVESYYDVIEFRPN